METYDLDQHDPRPRAQEGVEMTLLDAAGRPTRVKLAVRGTDCELYDETLRAQIRRGVDMAPRKKTEEEKNAEFWELHATLVAGWAPGTFKRKAANGESAPFEFSPANAAKLLEEYPYIFEQVRRFSDTRANFLPGPASG